MPDHPTPTPGAAMSERGEHTYGRGCHVCSVPPRYDHLTGKRLLGTCDYGTYTRKEIGFVLAHWDEAETVVTAPAHRSSRALLARWSYELRTLPRGHLCWCTCKFEREGCALWHTKRHNPRNHACAGEPSPPCVACRTLQDRQQYVDVADEIGRTEMVTAPLPDTRWLDIIMAIKAGQRHPAAIAAWLSGRRAA